MSQFQLEARTLSCAQITFLLVFIIYRKPAQPFSVHQSKDMFNAFTAGTANNLDLNLGISPPSVPDGDECDNSVDFNFSCSPFTALARVINKMLIFLNNIFFSKGDRTEI